MIRDAKRLIAAGVVVLGTAVTAWAGGKNLQFYPKDTSDTEIRSEMRMMNRSLGARCGTCHERDRSADTDKKKFCRTMLEMTKGLNAKQFTKELLGEKIAKANCYMCHKGSTEVELEPEKADDEKKFNDSVAAGRHKRTVDAMKKLVDALNKDYFTWKDAPKATCWMCHRGKFEFQATLPSAGEKRDDDSKRERKSDDGDERKSDDGKKHEGGDGPF
jgi:hypothetical protein